jgi:hypothetical protein
MSPNAGLDRNCNPYCLFSGRWGFIKVFSFCCDESGGNFGEHHKNLLFSSATAEIIVGSWPCPALHSPFENTKSTSLGFEV